jgi:hypothetical protein
LQDLDGSATAESVEPSESAEHAEPAANTTATEDQVVVSLPVVWLLFMSFQLAQQ